MNAIQKFYNLWNIDSLKYSERMNVVTIEFRSFDTPFPSLEKIKEIIELFPKRDELTLTITNISEESLIITNNIDICGDFSNFLEEIEDEDFYITLDIKKNVENNVLSIYDFDCFITYITNKSIVEIIRAFHTLLSDREYIFFQLLDKEFLFSTTTMIFSNDLEQKSTINFSRKRKLKICNEFASFYSRNEYKLIPEDFDINSDTSNVTLERLFSTIRVILSMVYIADNSDINKGILSIEIYGQKKYQVSYNINNDIIPNEEIYKIYKWVSTDGNALDKVIIARNIISLYTQVMDIMNIDEQIFSSIQSNFKLYQKSNVDKYLELKNKLAEYLLELANRAADIVIEILDNLKKNMLGCFTFLFSVALANIVSNQPVNNIFTKDITFLSELILCGSFIFLLISRYEINYRLTKLNKGYIELKEHYVDILEESDINDIFQNNKLFNSHMKDAQKKKRLFLTIWFILLLICLISVELVSKSPIILPRIEGLLRLLFS